MSRTSQKALMYTILGRCIFFSFKPICFFCIFIFIFFSQNVAFFFLCSSFKQKKIFTVYFRVFELNMYFSAYFGSYGPQWSPLLKFWSLTLGKTKKFKTGNNFFLHICLKLKTKAFLKSLTEDCIVGHNFQNMH